MAPQNLWTRDIGQEVGNVRNTFSSWDTCMSANYCRYPVIVGIIIGSLIVISVLWCCARCMCCGKDCCCSICSCCPCPRGGKRDGYQQAQPMQQPYQQYQPPQQPMMYGGAGTGHGYRGAQTATFDAPGRAKVNEDALPPMPSWQDAQSKHVQDEEVEMEKLDQNSAQKESLLSTSGGRYYNNDFQSTAGDLGAMQASPYHDYDAHRQYAGSPTESTAPSSMYPPTYHTRPDSSVYGEPRYAPSMAPSYHTSAPNVTSPTPQYAMPVPNVARRPVEGTWRDV